MSKIEEHKKDPKKLWETLRPLGTKENPKQKQGKIGLDINGSLLYDKKWWQILLIIFSQQLQVIWYRSFLLCQVNEKQLMLGGG